MIKLVFVLRRRDEMTREEFQRYWREEHAQLVKRHADALRIRRYVQAHTRETGFDAALAEPRGVEVDAFDGVAELWWDSLEELVAAATSEEGLAAGQALLEDEQRFIDLPRSPIWLADENVVIDAP
jgi:uncharacterized protein (TIGR02118 family)